MSWRPKGLASFSPTGWVVPPGPPLPAPFPSPDSLPRYHMKSTAGSQGSPRASTHSSPQEKYVEVPPRQAYSHCASDGSSSPVRARNPSGALRSSQDTDSTGSRFRSSGGSMRTSPSPVQLPLKNDGTGFKAG